MLTSLINTVASYNHVALTSIAIFLLSGAIYGLFRFIPKYEAVNKTSLWLMRIIFQIEIGIAIFLIYIVIAK
jgi:hypothetical protein